MMLGIFGNLGAASTLILGVALQLLPQCGLQLCLRLVVPRYLFEAGKSVVEVGLGAWRAFVNFWKVDAHLPLLLQLQLLLRLWVE